MRLATEVFLDEIAAWRDLDEIYDWVADGADPDAAEKYIRRILGLCGRSEITRLAERHAMIWRRHSNASPSSVVRQSRID